jgi:hypothetical protein
MTFLIPQATRFSASTAALAPLWASSCLPGLGALGHLQLRPSVPMAISMFHQRLLAM